MQAKVIIDVKDLSISYGSTQILKNANFVIREGDVVLLSGQNGSGKSTVLNTLAGILENGKVGGSITCFGKDILQENDLQWFFKQKTHVEQEHNFIMPTPLEEIDYYSSLYNANLTETQIAELFERYGLRKLLKKKIASLSGGQKKMVALLSALVTNVTKLIFIDEPLNNLDMNNVCKISDLITHIHHSRKDAAIILVSHCRVFPVINRELFINNGIITEINDNIICHNCFGVADEEGYYNKEKI